MATFSISKVRESLSDAVELSQTEAAFLERHGKQAAVRVGDYRVIYTAQDDVLLVAVVTLGHRRDDYDR